MKRIALLIFSIIHIHGIAQDNLNVVHSDSAGNEIRYLNFLEKGNDIIGFGSAENSSWISCFSKESLQVKWAKRLSYSSPYKVLPIELIEMPSAIWAFVLVDNTNNGNDFAALISYDLNGNLNWSKRLDIDPGLDGGYDIYKTSENKVVVTWIYEYYSIRRLICVQLDDQGNVEFELGISTEGGNSTGFASDTNDYNYLAAGSMIYKLDSNFNLVWTRQIKFIYGGSEHPVYIYPHKFMKWINGVLIIAGTLDNWPYYPPVLLKVDSSGTTILAKSFEGGSMDPVRWYYNSNENTLSCFGLTTFDDTGTPPFYNELAIDIDSFDQVAGFKYLGACEGWDFCDIGIAGEGQRMNEGFLFSTNLLTERKDPFWTSTFENVLSLHFNYDDQCYIEKVNDNDYVGEVIWQTETIVIEEDQVEPDTVTFHSIKISKSSQLQSNEFCAFTLNNVEVEYSDHQTYRFVDHSLFLSGAETKNLDIRLYDALGRTIERYSGPVSGKYSFKNIRQSGIYLIVVLENESVIFSKKVVQY